MELHEVSDQLSIQQFWHEYFLRGVPVIFRRAPLAHLLHTNALVDHVNQLLEEGKADGIGFSIWLSSDHLESVAPQPTWVAYCFESQDTHFLHKNTRIFSCPKGHHTSWHYDANLLFNFNLQLMGSKKWTLISPMADFKHYGFSHYGLVNNDPVDFGPQSVTFTLNPGDMVYIPPLWIHQVTAHEENSLSVSWIGANPKAIVPSKLFQREIEILRVASLLKKFPLCDDLAKLMGDHKKYFSQYAGRGWSYIDQLSSNISSAQVCIRLFKELLYTPHYFLHRKKIHQAIKKPEMIFKKSEAHIK